MKKKIVVLGCAPIDWRFMFLLRALKHSTNIYHTSWHAWDGTFYPKITKLTFLNNILEKKWKTGLENNFNAIAAVSTTAKKSLLSNYSLDNLFIKTVYHAYEDEVFYSKIKQKEPFETIRILYVGRFIECKGVELIFNIADKLPDIDFTLIGDGPLKQSMLKASTKNVSILDFTSSRIDLSILMRRHDILIQPSLRTQDWEELFGMAIIEGMASGLVPICTAHAGPMSILTNTHLESNLLHEGVRREELVTNFVKAISKYKSNYQILDEHKEFASLIATRFRTKEISKNWMSILSSIEEQ